MKKKTSLKKQSRLSGALAVSISQALVLMLGYITHLWIGRVLGPAPYGIYGVVLSVQTIFGLLLTLGVPAAVSRFVAQNEESAASLLKRSIKIQIVIALLVTIVLVLASPLLSLWLGDANLIPYLIFTAAVLFFQAFYPVYTQFLGGMHLFNKQAILTGVYAVAKLAGALALLYAFEVYGAFAGFAIGGFIAAIIGWYFTKDMGGKKEISLPLKSFLSFAGLYVFMLVGLQILISMDLFMVKALLHNDLETGYYNAASTLSRIPYFLLQGLSFILLPSVAALTKPGESHNRAAVFIRDVLRYLIGLIVPSVALAAVTSKGLVILFFSQDFLPAAPALSILIVGLGSLAFYLLMANIVAGANKTKVVFYMTYALIIISAVVGYVLIPRMGLLGAAWQTTIAGLLGAIALSLYTFKAFDIPMPLKSTVNILIASAVAVLPTYIWKVSPILLPIQYICLLLLYLLTLFILQEIKKDDWNRLATLHPKIGSIINKVRL